MSSWGIFCLSWGYGKCLDTHVQLHVSLGMDLQITTVSQLYQKNKMAQLKQPLSVWLSILNRWQTGLCHSFEVKQKPFNYLMWLVKIITYALQRDQRYLWELFFKWQKVVMLLIWERNLIAKSESTLYILRKVENWRIEQIHQMGTRANCTGLQDLGDS